MKLKSLLFSLIVLTLISCQQEQSIVSNENSLFSQVSSDHSGIRFVNNFVENNEFNFLNYSYAYLGGGVAAGDINNDGLIDLVFSSNQQENRLYLNKGEFVFEDITLSANIKSTEGWTTGINMIDINNDGWLDIYECKSASANDPKLRENKLFINQKDNTFKEEGQKWGVNDPGYSIQSYYLDYDKDGDLDMYVVNHRPDFHLNMKINSAIQGNIQQETSDQLYRNEGSHFVNVSKQAGIQNKAWGLSASIGDFNGDNWPDVYVANDFLEPDILYINQRNGRFRDEILARFRHITFNSMGSDYADMNNDGLLDLCVLDMTPSDHKRSKENMASMDTKGFLNMVAVGYHHQYMFNGLQMNTGAGYFSDIGQLAGISKTDWSWAPLMADFNNDGHKDLFITNGIVKDISNRDFLNNLAAKNQQGESMKLTDVLAMIPEKKLPNHMYMNQGRLQFQKVSKKWGLDQPSYSNGATYADLDNDGDLDLAINNAKDEAFIYQNNTSDHWLQIKLNGPSTNHLAIGTKINIKSANANQYQELYLNRGFQSSVPNVLHFGLGQDDSIEKITVTWPDGKETILQEVKGDQLITINYDSATNKQQAQAKPNRLLQRINQQDVGLDYIHRENDYYEYSQQVLLPHAQATNGPFLSKADVNSDGLEDLYVGGALGQPGQLLLQKANGHFAKASTTTWLTDRAYEDLSSIFLDYDGDGDQDLYVVSGGTERGATSQWYQDRLYQNNGQGKFTKTTGVLPDMPTSCQSVVASDIDKDGDIDIFVGGRIIADKYPYSPKSYLLLNQNGKFEDKTKEFGPELVEAGMISQAVFSDYDGDGDDDLLMAGEWSTIQLFENNQGHFSKKDIPALEKTRGLWFSMSRTDWDGDGDDDYFLGNLGLNAKFHADHGKEFHIFCDDFDGNGTYDIVLSNDYNGQLVPVRGKQCSTQQMPGIKNQFPTYETFADACINDMFSQEQLDNALHYQADMLYNVFVENKGNGNFTLHQLPDEAQISPIMDFIFEDLNGDGQDELITIGNMFNAEVETERYDASYGLVMEYQDNQFKPIPTLTSGLLTHGDTKDAIVIPSANQKKRLIITNNNSALDVLEY